MIDPTVVFVCILLAWREYQHERDRAAWTQERRALMQQAAPGLVIAAKVEPPLPAYGTDEWESDIERERQGAG